MDSTSVAAAAAASEEEEACLRALQLMSLSVLPMTLKAAIELGVFEAIANTGAHFSAIEIAASLPATISNPQAPIMLDRILQLLASYSILTCSINPIGERCYRAELVVKYLTPNRNGVSLSWMGLINQDRVTLESWHHLKDAVMEGGIPFNKAYGMTLFEYFGTNPRFNKIFNNTMSGHSSIIINKVLESYRGFCGLGLLVDIGGGIGSTLEKITAKYPGIKGINFDLPHVISEAPPLPGVEHVGGNMFSNVPSGDAIFMKWILHNWSDEHCSKLLKNCWKALPENGKVIVVESFLPEKPEPTLAAQNVFLMDLIMLAHFPEGKERSEGEFESLAKQAGFSEFKSIYIFSGYWLMEFTKQTK